MTLAIVYSRACTGIHSPLVTVEVHLSRGMPGLHIVGLPATAVKESKDRVRSALINAGLEFPRRRMTVNLAPADLPKEGGGFDLPIALGILAASGQVPQICLNQYEWTGELALSGELRHVSGVLPRVLMSQSSGRILVVPAVNAAEAGLVKNTKVFFAKHILEICAHLKGESSLSICEHLALPMNEPVDAMDFSDVKGQGHAKRALEVAAAGGHSALLMGPPGTGKTMLASRFRHILPPLNESQALEIASVLSVSKQGFDPGQWSALPFRSPHHTSSSAALVGGGRPPLPGEISLAHHGILFLDELPEFGRAVLETLREPLESGCITLSRAGYQMSFPAKFQLIAAMNPCPCGFFGSINHQCVCTSEQIQRYFGKLSGPLLDRIDIQVEVPSVSADSMLAIEKGEKSECIKARVINARMRQLTRQNKLNNALSSSEIIQCCQIQKETGDLLKQMIGKFNLSARSYDRILRLARTIADLEKSDTIQSAHINEGLLLRCLERRRLNSNDL